MACSICSLTSPPASHVMSSKTDSSLPWQQIHELRNHQPMRMKKITKWLYCITNMTLCVMFGRPFHVANWHMMRRLCSGREASGGGVLPQALYKLPLQVLLTVLYIYTLLIISFHKLYCNLLLSDVEMNSGKSFSERQRSLQRYTRHLSQVHRLLATHAHTHTLLTLYIALLCLQLPHTQLIYERRPWPV